jgi:hypothetical protein
LGRWAFEGLAEEAARQIAWAAAKKCDHDVAVRRLRDLVQKDGVPPNWLNIHSSVELAVQPIG